MARRRLYFGGVDATEDSPATTRRWLHAVHEILKDASRQAGDVDGIPLPMRQAFERCCDAAERAAPLFNGTLALSLPPAERLKPDRAPAYFELIADLAEAETLLLLALFAERNAALSAWCRGADGEGKPGEDRDGVF